MSTDPAAQSLDSAQSLQSAVVELERHVSGGGWDAPVRLYALVRTARVLAAQPDLADKLPRDVVAAAATDPHHLFSVEQEGLAASDDLASLLGGIAWPDDVDGAALVVERIVVPPEVEADMPQQEDEALEWLQAHPTRTDVRIAAAVLRDGQRACAVRTRSNDSDDAVGVGQDVVPGLTEALAATLR